MPGKSNKNQVSEELIGNIPGWTLRWGIWIIFLIILLIIISCYLIKYPNIVTGKVQLTANNPPVELLPHISGRIAGLFVSEGDQVKVGTNLLVLESTADYNDILVINTILSDIPMNWEKYILKKEIYRQYKLGDVQSSFLQFQKQCAVFRNYLQTSLIAKKHKILNLQISKQIELLDWQKKQVCLYEKDYVLSCKNFTRDSLIFVIGGLAQADYEKALQSLLQKETTLIGHKSSIGSTELTLLNLRENLLENQIQRESELHEYYIGLNDSYQQLKNRMEQWKKDYLIVAPVSGKVFFSKIWNENQNVMISERVATIFPDNEISMLARMSVPYSDYSAIELGQIVNIKLDNYPYMEFGIVHGKINSISPIPDKEGYNIEITFPDGLMTTYGIQLKYVYQMIGRADIVTKDMRLLEQFFQPLKAIYDKIKL